MKISLLRKMKLSTAEKFAALRLAHCKSVEETALQLKLTVARYTDIENGTIYATERMIRKIAKYYRLTHDEFLVMGEADAKNNV